MQKMETVKPKKWISKHTERGWSLLAKLNEKETETPRKAQAEPVAPEVLINHRHVPGKIYSRPQSYVECEAELSNPQPLESEASKCDAGINRKRIDSEGLGGLKGDIEKLAQRIDHAKSNFPILIIAMAALGFSGLGIYGLSFYQRLFNSRLKGKKKGGHQLKKKGRETLFEEIIEGYETDCTTGAVKQRNHPRDFITCDAFNT